jgi:Flp pilus assembly protein TadG
VTESAGSGRRSGSGRRLGDRGSVVLEYAILLPAVLAMLFVCVQVALYSYARSVAQTAAEEAVNAQRAYGASADAGSKAADKVIGAQGDTLKGPSVRVTTVNGEVRVVVTGTTQSVLPGFGGYHVTQTASGPVERFRR